MTRPRTKPVPIGTMSPAQRRVIEALLAAAKAAKAATP